MLFTPKKRGRDWYWFNMVFLYGFSLAFGAATIAFPFSSTDDLSGRIIGTLMFAFATLIMWMMGRYCSKMVAKMRDPR